MPNLYKNSEGKVLLSAGSRIIKQPYNFGKMFGNTAGLNNYIKISNLNLSANSQVMAWVTVPHTNDSKVYPFFNIRNNTDNQLFSLYAIGNDNSGYTKNTLPTSGAGFGLIYANSNFPQTLNLVSVIARNDNTSTLKSAYRTLDTTGLSITPVIINEIWIAAARSSAGTTPSNYARPTTKYSEFVVFDRELTDSEFKFYYSNACGSELQSTVGISVYLKNNFAEILDFSTLQDGTDLRVGVRDYSGFNRHGEIINLPAGTIQYKLDYANTNLFV